MHTLRVVGEEAGTPNPSKQIRGITFMGGRETGDDPDYIKAAHDLGQIQAENKIPGYFGGSQFGLMGAYANGILGHNGEVIGIMPHFLKDVEKPLDCVQIIWVEDFPQRLLRFRDLKLVDAIVNFPGGVGTDAEHMDFATNDKHERLGLPNILVNINGFYDYRIMDLRRRHARGFLWNKPARRLFIASDVTEVLPMIRAFYAGDPVQNIFDAPVAISEHQLQAAG